MRSLICPSFILLILLQIPAETGAQDSLKKIIDNSLILPICGTGMNNMPEMDDNKNCPSYGPCDDPTIRDAHIPDENTPINYITLQFNSFCNDDGSSPAINLYYVLAHIGNLNDCYEPWHIQFDYDWRFIYSSEYHTIHNEGEEFESPELWAAMELAMVNGSQSLNIHALWYYTNWGGEYGPHAAATYPWWPRPEGIGSIFISPLHNDQFVLCHEVGHCLGLWHTFEFDGTYWVEPCGPCYDSPGGGDDDYKGDMCSDTPPTTITDGTCDYPGGNDTCSGLAWGVTDISNIMDYTPAFCKDHFTSQQAGRMHCWSEYATPGWISYARINFDVNFGPAPLTVQFEGVTSMTSYSWDWDFDDGTLGNGGSPSHIYTEPGIYSPTVDLDAAEGTFDATIARDIWVHGDTLTVSNAMTMPGQSVRVDINVTNYVPLDNIEMPLRWDGPAELTLDSFSTVGLRSESFPTPQWIYLNESSQEGYLQLKTFNEFAMTPGTGGLISFWFTPDTDVSYAENSIRVEPVGLDIQFHNIRGSYVPEVINGSVTVCEPGISCGDCYDTDQDGYGNPGYGNACPDDNCPDIYNPDQADVDSNGIGDICFLVPTIHDTINTSCTRLDVANDGTFGNASSASLDYFLGGDCATKYIDLGSTIISYDAEGAGHVNSYALENRLQPINDNSALTSSSTTPNFEVFESGTMITPDTLFGLNITWWAPTDVDDCHFVIQLKKVFLYGDKEVSSIAIGDGVNWDIPMSQNMNHGGYDIAYAMIYQYGGVSADPAEDCRDNTRRFGAIALLGSKLNNDRTRGEQPYGGHVEPLMNYLIGDTIIDPVLLFDLMHRPGYSSSPGPDDYFSTMIYENDIDLSGEDTLYVYSAMISLLDGTLDDLRIQVDRAKTWAYTHAGLTFATFTCGDVDDSGVINILDITFLISYLYNQGPPPDPLESADVDGISSVNILDIVYLIRYLYKGGPEPICP